MSSLPISAIILAAGRSSRMGSPKQLLQFNGKNMLEMVIESVAVHAFAQVVVVVGHQHQQIMNSVKLQNVKIDWVLNEKYMEGQSTSFAKGIQQMKNTISSAMFFLGDQPFIQKETIDNIIMEGEEKQKQVSSPFVIRPFYIEEPGHPVLFHNIRNLDLTQLSGDEGGKGLMQQIKNKVKLQIDDPFTTMDIDTPKDYEKALELINRANF
ncbi:nucleotidyltransferase family protein [Evansella sp. AB-rgal1]|uniref:nucleotidyltransferase family protein n=1 Tax=Evansella sp. AB-rgal1 TaxID=3242696 RepID=UPI00359E5C59